MRLGVLASGRGSNLQAILDASREGRLESTVAVVVSDVADAAALDRAEDAGVPARHVPPGRPGARLTPEAARACVRELEAHAVDLVVLAGFMRIVGRSFFERFPGRILNIHPSLLPAYRGLHPQRRALEDGVRVSGCTVHLVVPEVDAGPILGQASVPVHEDDTEAELSARILREEHRLYVETIRRIETGALRLDSLRV